MTHDYKRHGTTTLFATRNVLDGNVIGRCMQQHRHEEAWGETIGVAATGRATCPVAALQTWMAAAGIAPGPVFRSIDRHGRVGSGISGRAIALIVKARARAIGLRRHPASRRSHRRYPGRNRCENRGPTERCPATIIHSPRLRPGFSFAWTGPGVANLG